MPGVVRQANLFNDAARASISRVPSGPGRATRTWERAISCTSHTAHTAQLPSSAPCAHNAAPVCAAAAHGPPPQMRATAPCSAAPAPKLTRPLLARRADSTITRLIRRFVTWSASISRSGTSPWLSRRLISTLACSRGGGRAGRAGPGRAGRAAKGRVSGDVLARDKGGGARFANQGYEASYWWPWGVQGARVDTVGTGPAAASAGTTGARASRRACGGCG